MPILVNVLTPLFTNISIILEAKYFVIQIVTAISKFTARIRQALKQN